MDKVTYNIMDLNDTHLNIVCRVPDEESFYSLKKVCPDMVDDYYLTSRGGRGTYSAYKSSSPLYGSSYYQFIEMGDIDWDVKNIIFDNGIPMMWGDDI